MRNLNLNELKLFWLIIERDLFKANGVIKVEKKRYNIKTKHETRKKRLTTFIFFTPEVHNIINSFSWICFTIKIINDNKKARGINFVKMLNKFKNEYWK